MSRNVFEKFVGATQVNKTKVRKSLQTLQVSSDEKGITGNNMVLPNNESVPSKKKLSVVNKVIATEKENAPFLRRSKRTTAVTGLLKYAESPDHPSTSKSVSTKTKKSVLNASTKTKKNVLKPKKGRQTTLKKNKQEIDSNQKRLNLSPVTSMLNKNSSVPESAHTDKSILGTSAPSEAKVTEDSGINLTNRDSTQSLIHSTPVPQTVAIKQQIGIPDKETSILIRGPIHSTEVPEAVAMKQQVGIPDKLIPDETSILTCVDPPLVYWKEIAEQRRIALEKALHENELLHDELTVLEAENSQLKQLLKEAENLAQVVRDIIQ